MLGAVIGDIVGSRFEWDNIKTKDFQLFHEKCSFTDDTVMSVAVCKALLCSNNYSEDLSENTVKYMKILGRKYIDSGYGGRFLRWLISDGSEPYGSYGNGSAMRVSGCGWAADSLDEAKQLAKITAEVTHNHYEGIKGAEATSCAVYLARTGYSKNEIKKFINENYYDISFTLDEIRPDYTFDVTCQGSVPQALEAFFESESFEDTIRNAISIGGDSDTIAAIAGGIAEAYYGIPEEIRNSALDYLDDCLSDVIDEFEEKYKPAIL